MWEIGMRGVFMVFGFIAGMIFSIVVGKLADENSDDEEIMDGIYLD